jgi:hypothetical protein
MNTAIMNWSNHLFYDDRLKADQSVADRQVEGVPVLAVVDTHGWGMLELVDGLTETKSNPGEV